MSKNIMLDAALSFAKKGFAVFPAKFVGKSKLSCTSAEKSNGNAWGFTRDPDEIRAYWKRYPYAAIGLPTGAVNGFFVLDLDTEAGHDQNGEASLRLLLQQNRKDLPLTRGAFTPTGGLHLYYKQPPNIAIPCSTSKLGPGIDVRGDGGFVIAPPSVRPRVGAYEWQTTIGSSSIKPAPAWLLKLLTRPEQISCDPVVVAMMVVDSGKGLSSRKEDNSLHPTDADPRSKIQAALEYIPADIDYLSWFRIGCAIYSELGDSGFALFDNWSSQSVTKYDPRGCATKWRECAKSRSIKVNTLYYIADEYEPNWRIAYDADRAEPNWREALS